MKEDSSCSKHSVDVINCLLDISTIQTIQSCLLYYAIHLEIRPLFGNINSLPLYPSLQVSLFTLLLVYQGPTEIRTNQIFISPFEKIVQHTTFTTTQFQYLRTMIDKLSEQLLDDLGLHIPIINLLLLQFIPSVPVRFNIVVRQILRESIRDKKLFVLTQLSQLIFLLNHNKSI